MFFSRGALASFHQDRCFHVVDRSFGGSKPLGLQRTWVSMMFTPEGPPAILLYTGHLDSPARVLGHLHFYQPSWSHGKYDNTYETDTVEWKLAETFIWFCCVETEPFFCALTGRTRNPQKMMTNYVVLGIQVLQEPNMIRKLWMMYWLKPYCHVDYHID